MSKIQMFQTTKILILAKKIPSPSACLREAASAKAGEGVKGRGMVRQAYHEFPLSMSKGHPHLDPPPSGDCVVMSF